MACKEKELESIKNLLGLLVKIILKDNFVA